MKGSTGVLPFIFDAISSNMKGSTPVLPFIFDFLLNKLGPCMQCIHENFLAMRSALVAEIWVARPWPFQLRASRGACQ